MRLLIGKGEEIAQIVRLTRALFHPEIHHLLADCKNGILVFTVIKESSLP